MFEYVLRSTYFIYDGGFYEKVDGIDMGSPLSSVVADVFMEAFELEILDAATLKQKVYKYFVDDMLLIWLHGHETLAGFVDFLNSRH